MPSTELFMSPALHPPWKTARHHTHEGRLELLALPLPKATQPPSAWIRDLKTGEQ